MGDQLVQHNPSRPIAAPVPLRPLEAVWAGLALLAAFAPTLWGIVASWFDEQSDMGHGVFVPLAAGYMVWLRRNDIKSIPVNPSAWGLLAVFVSTLGLILAMATQWFWGARMAFMLSLTGVLVALYGFRLVRELAYPLCTLLLMITPPQFIFERATLPLQLLASRLGEISLESLGYSVLREGNILELVGERLAVEEACSGIRSLMALSFLSVVYCYFFVRQTSLRITLILAVIPIAILCNALRILLTGVVGQYNRELAHGILHDAFGHFSLSVAALVSFLLHRVLVKLPTWRDA